MPLQTIEKCCLCTKPFDQGNFPRILPSCYHSICTNCLKNTFKNAVKTIECSFCGNREQIIEADLEYFPKNISLIKSIKDTTSKTSLSGSQHQTPKKSNPLITTPLSSSKPPQPKQFLQHDQSLISQKSSSTTKKQLCPQHNKQTQLICLTHFTKICPMCAIFGPHKEHQLKTIEETQQILNDTMKEFEQAKVRKKTLDNKIKNAQFKAVITKKITDAKEILSKQIKDSFLLLKQAVTTAQKNANQDLNKRFKEVYEKINKLAKEESEFQSFFSNWLRTVELELAQSLRQGISFEEKVQVYFNGPLKQMKEGQFYLAQIESFTEAKKVKMQAIPSQVSIQLGQNLIKDIYNYLNVKFTEDLTLPYSENLLTTSRADNNTLLTQCQPIQQPIESYTTPKQCSAQKISSTTSIPSNTQPIQKRPIKVEFSSSQNFLSPARDSVTSPSNTMPPRKSPRQKSKSLPKAPITSNNLIKSRISPSKVQVPNTNNPISQERRKYLSLHTDGIVELFVTDQKLDTLDLCSFDMPDNQILMLLDYVNNKKRIKCLKLSQNKLTNEGFTQILPHLKWTTNVNLSTNLLTQDVLNVLIKFRQKVPNLRILNLAHNKVNQRKAKVYVDQLKRQGIIVTL